MQGLSDNLNNKEARWVLLKSANRKHRCSQAQLFLMKNRASRLQGSGLSWQNRYLYLLITLLKARR